MSGLELVKKLWNEYPPQFKHTRPSRGVDHCPGEMQVLMGEREQGRKETQSSPTKGTHICLIPPFYHTVNIRYVFSSSSFQVIVFQKLESPSVLTYRTIFNQLRQACGSHEDASGKDREASYTAPRQSQKYRCRDKHKQTHRDIERDISRWLWNISFYMQ